MLGSIITGFSGITWANVILVFVALIFIYLAIAKKWEPYELLPIGVGLLLANLPNSGILIKPYEVGGEFGRAGLLGILIEFTLGRLLKWDFGYALKSAESSSLRSLSTIESFNTRDFWYPFLAFTGLFVGFPLISFFIFSLVF